MLTSRNLKIIVTECFDAVVDQTTTKAVGDIPLSTLNAGLQDDAAQPTRNFPGINTPIDFVNQYNNLENIKAYLKYVSNEQLLFSCKNTGGGSASSVCIYHEKKLQTILDQHQATLLIYGWPLTAKEFFDEINNRIGEGKMKQLIANCFDNKEYPLLEAEHFENNRALKLHVLRELFDTGINKPIGRLPWESLDYLKLDINNICRQLEEQGLQTKIYDGNSSFTKSGMLYVWDKAALQAFITENATTFQMYNIPIDNVEQFIDTIAIEQFGMKHELRHLVDRALSLSTPQKPNDLNVSASPSAPD